MKDVFTHTKVKCKGCSTIYFVARGSVDFLCDCTRKNSDGTEVRKTNDFTKIRLNEDAWNYLGMNSDDKEKSKSNKKREVFQENYPVTTYNEV